jgi:NAD(P)-dependent dehydrogenase (short-subunit alcohol dehydrogenase family)
MMTYDLNDKVVLITGAAGGIGAATARELYALGASLVLTDMQQTAVDQLAKEFSPSRVLPVALDVTDAAATKAVVQQTIERFGRWMWFLPTLAFRGVVAPQQLPVAMRPSSRKSWKWICLASGARFARRCRRLFATRAKSLSRLPYTLFSMA